MPSMALVIKSEHLKQKLGKLKDEMRKLKAHEKRMLASADEQVSLTDPDSRSMATSGRGAGVVERAWPAPDHQKSSWTRPPLATV